MGVTLHVGVRVATEAPHFPSVSSVMVGRGVIQHFCVNYTREVGPPSTYIAYLFNKQA
jgi:hypothetical protein